jgi:hypothetical protein
MLLIDACADFTESADRSSMAGTCCALIEVAQTSIREHVPEDAGPALVRAIVVARARSVDQSVQSVRVWSTCAPLALIDVEPWDPLCLLLFLTECHLRICVTHLYSTKGGWKALGDAPVYDVPLQIALHAEEWRRTPLELEAGLELRRVDALIAERDIERAAVALVVCFEGGAEGAAVPTVRASRADVRLLERAFLLDNLRFVIGVELGVYRDLDDLGPDPFEHADALTAWMIRTVEVDANNALLLRLDEWAVCCALVPSDIGAASGERGGVPQEHRNGPSAWILQKVKTDDEYRQIMAASKKNTEHAENVYMCFAGMLEQHFSFDWATRCLVARINPAVALRKIREYAKVANASTPPLIVQREEGRATVISVHGRVECDTAARALSAWIVMVVVHMAGAYTRKANIADVIERIRKPPDRQVDNQPQEIVGGASIALRETLD